MTDADRILPALDGSNWVTEGRNSWRKPLWRRASGDLSVALLKLEAGGRSDTAAATGDPNRLLYCISGRYGDEASEAVMEPGSVYLVPSGENALPMTALEPSLLLEILDAPEAASEGGHQPDDDPLSRIGNRLLISNELVNIWDVDLAPGESIPWHIHRFPYVVVTVEGGRAAIVDKATGQARQADGRPGNVTFDPGGAHHRLDNVGDRRIVDRLIEFKRSPALIRPPRIQHKEDPAE